MQKHYGVCPQLGTRLRRWRQSTGMRAYTLAKQIKLSQGSISDIENNNSHPSANTLTKLHRLTQINILWLLTGRGEIVRPPSPEEKPAKIDWQLKALADQVTRIYEQKSKAKNQRLSEFLTGLENE